MRSKVIYRPEKETAPRCRFIVGFRFAPFYPEGTLIEHRGEMWLRMADHEYDSWPWWEPTLISAPRQPTPEEAI